VNSQEVTVTLPIESINAALVALSKFPYEQAQPHIDLIRSRVDAVIKTAAPDTESEGGEA
jgi:hypothetical protein